MLPLCWNSCYQDLVFQICYHVDSYFICWFYHFRHLHWWYSILHLTHCFSNYVLFYEVTWTIDCIYFSLFFSLFYYCYHMQTLCSKASNGNFFDVFSYLHHYCQHTIIIPYTLFTNKILISLTVLSAIINSPYESISFCLTLGLTLGLINSFPTFLFASRYFFSVAYRFPLPPMFTRFAYTVIKNIILRLLATVHWNNSNNLRQIHKPRCSFWTHWHRSWNHSRYWLHKISKFLFFIVRKGVPALPF